MDDAAWWPIRWSKKDLTDPDEAQNATMPFVPRRLKYLSSRSDGPRPLKATSCNVVTWLHEDKPIYYIVINYQYSHQHSYTDNIFVSDLLTLRCLLLELAQNSDPRG